MATNVTIGLGASYAIWDTTITTPAYVTLGEVTDITLGEESVDRIEATHMGSPNRRREFLAGLVDTGEASFTINWVPGSATDLLLRRLSSDGSKNLHKVTLPNLKTVIYEAYVGAYSKSMPLDDRMTATVTVVKTGTETWSV